MFGTGRRADGGPQPWRGEDATVRSLRIRLVLPLTLVGVVVGVGTVGYYWLWRPVGGTWMDALFMTVTTITPIGYGEVRPLDTPGRLLTIAVAITGIASLFFTFTVVMEYLVAVRLADPAGRRRIERAIEALRGHVVVAGLGRVGRQAAGPGRRCLRRDRSVGGGGPDRP